MLISFFEHLELSSAPVFRDKRTSKRLRIEELESTHSGIYSVLAFPMRYRPVSKFVRILEDKTVQASFVLPVDPSRVTRVEFPPFEELGSDLKHVLIDSEVEGNEGLRGRELYEAFDDIRRAGLLNIYSKMRVTRFPNGKDAFSFVKAFRRVRGSRFFADVQKELRDEVKNSIHADLFNQVSGALHTPPPGFISADSFKTLDRYGNLQLTFFSKPDTLDFMIDADIDDARGIEHVFQVVSHSISGRDSHPFDIREILLQSQKIDPGYRLIV